jgi:hypothetical protein
VPDGLHLGTGLTGVVVATRPDGPVPLLEIAIGSRHVEARWEWDLEAPAIGSVVEIAARPETIRFFGAGTAAHVPEHSAGPHLDEPEPATTNVEAEA